MSWMLWVSLGLVDLLPTYILVVFSFFFPSVGVYLSAFCVCGLICYSSMDGPRASLYWNLLVTTYLGT